MATRFSTSRRTSSNTASLGSETSSRLRASGRAAATIRRSQGKTFSSHHRATSGKERRRSVSPVGAQSTTIASNSLRLVVALDLEQREELVHAGRHGQLLGRDGIDPALREELAEPLTDRVPVALHLLLRLDLLPPQLVPARGRRRAELDLEAVRQRMGRIGGEDDGAKAALRQSPGGGGGHARLADPALAGVEDRARGQGAHRSAAGVPHTEAAAARRSLRAALRRRSSRRRCAEALDDRPYRGVDHALARVLLDEVELPEARHPDHRPLADVGVAEGLDLGG